MWTKSLNLKSWPRCSNLSRSRGRWCVIWSSWGSNSLKKTVRSRRLSKKCETGKSRLLCRRSTFSGSRSNSLCPCRMEARCSSKLQGSQAWISSLVKKLLNQSEAAEWRLSKIRIRLHLSNHSLLQNCSKHKAGRHFCPRLTRWCISSRIEKRCWRAKKKCRSLTFSQLNKWRMLLSTKLWWAKTQMTSNLTGSRSRRNNALQISVSLVRIHTNKIKQNKAESLSVESHPLVWLRIRKFTGVVSW